MILRGPEALRRLLRHVCDLRRDDFAHWLSRRLPLWQRDPIFCARQRLQALRTPELRRCERLLRETVDEPEFALLERQLHNTRRAVAGLQTVDRPEKLAHFQAKLQRLLAEVAQRTARSPARRERLRLQAEVARLREEAGIPAAEAELVRLLREAGHRSSRGGRDFETEALHVIRQPGDTLHTGVTLGATRVELDQVLVAEGRVRAIVEVKRNPNDLARGYRHRQENLAWLRGELVDPKYRNSHYPDGRFTGTDLGSLRLTPQAFADTRLVLVSRPGTLWGASGQALARMAFRVSRTTDPLRLREWCLSLTSPFETPDLAEAACELVLALRENQAEGAST